MQSHMPDLVVELEPVVDRAQNVNFALKTEVARTFLDSKGIAYRKAPSDRQLSPPDVGDIARPFTVYLECHHNESASNVASIAAPDGDEGFPPFGERTKTSAPRQLPIKTADELFNKGKAAHAAKKYTEAMHC
jgi:hypothetical protein